MIILSRAAHLSITCQDCKRYQQVYGRNRKDAEDKLREQGWKISDTDQTCPPCSRKAIRRTPQPRPESARRPAKAKAAAR